MPAALNSLVLRSLPQSRRTLLQHASQLAHGHIAKKQFHAEAVAESMLAKANRDYKANQPPSSRNGLEKDLFPSSSPTPATGDIRDQMNKKKTASSGFVTSSPSQRAAAAHRSSRPLDTRSGNMMSDGGTGRGSLANLYGNSAASFKHGTKYIDLTDDTKTAAKTHEPVIFDVDDFSEDDDLDLDFKAPSAISPSKMISVTGSSTKENLPPPPPASAQSARSDIPIPWSSSPLSHFQPPPKQQGLSSTSQRTESPLKRESSGETDTLEAAAPKKKKKRQLPWSQKEAKQEDDDEVVEIRPESLATPGQKEGRGLWDPTASAIKEQKKQLKSQRNMKKEESDDVTGDGLQGESSKSLKPRSDSIALSGEQRYVVDLVVDKGQSVFFTGPAGTGKSVLMRAIINELKSKHGPSSERVAVTASTGLAACNIGGITLHSFAGIGLGKEDAATLIRKVRKNQKAKNRWLKTKCLIIDEISMVDGELFDKLSQIGRTLRNNGRPWGGIQLIITGDFFQLPPVPDAAKERDAKFAFDAATWETSISHTIGLTQVFRQRDPEFAQMLNEMRLGKISDSTVQAFKALDRPLKFEDGVDSAELFPLRAQVESSNERRLRELPGVPYRYEAADSGVEAIRDKLLANMMAPKAIALKVDAQVMLIKNLDETLVNGSLGKVIGFSDERTFEMGGANGSDDEDSAMSKAKKKLNSFSRDPDLTSSAGRKFPVVQFISANGTPRVILCQPEEWKVELPNGEVQAKRLQIPLILAWALSIHKAQGQTLERVTVNLGKVFEKGQAYVALSRATTQHGLRVVGFEKSKVMAHSKVVEFYNKLARIEGSGMPRTMLDFVAARRGV